MFSKLLQRRQLLLLMVFGFITCLSGFSISILGPFYSMIAVEKGVTLLQCGFVFSVYNLTMVIISFIYCKYTTVIGIEFMANAGTFILATTSILFGFLDKINNSLVFLILSIVIRIFEALGCASFRISANSILLNEFEDDQELVFGLLQAFGGIGLTMGPLLGVFLFDIGGFLLPFGFTGVLLLIGNLMGLCLKTRSENDGKILEENKIGIFVLLKEPGVILSIAVICGVALCTGFIVINLTLYVINLGFDKNHAGYFHACNGTSYFLSSFIWGKLCGKYLTPQSLWSIGSSLTVFGLLLTVILSSIFINYSVYLCIFGLIFYGMGISAEMVSSFLGLLEAAYSKGFQENISTYGLISSMYTTSFALGLFVGPTLAGFLDDLIGFMWSSLIYVVYQLIIIFITIYFQYCHKKEQYDSID